MANDPMKDALAGYGSPRIPMGTSAYTLANPKRELRGTLTPQNLPGGAGQDLGAGTAAVRPMGSRTGAQFRITSKVTLPEQEANTQANGRIIPPTHRRGKNFWSQAL